MDSFGVFADGEWESFNKVFFSNEDFDFTQQQLDDQGLHYITPSIYFPNSEPNNGSLLFCSSNTTLNSNNLHNLSQDTTSFGSHCSSTSVFNIPTSTHEATDDVSMFMLEEKFSSHGIAFHDIAMEETCCPINNATTDVIVAAKQLHLKRKFDEQAALLFHSSTRSEGDDRVVFNNVDSTDTNGKKRPRASRDSKKKQNLNVRYHEGNEGEESINGGSDGQSSTSTYNSEDDNASQETNNEESTKASLALNLNGKPRARRGSATDSQSLYARKRRERINERLKILQNLVPNGTKVDISTMLEEAVHYVKLLQFQIKLLSSDDLWMYAPLAYNGIDLSLNQKLSSFL